MKNLFMRVLRLVIRNNSAQLVVLVEACCVNGILMNLCMQLRTYAETVAKHFRVLQNYNCVVIIATFKYANFR